MRHALITSSQVVPCDNDDLTDNGRLIGIVNARSVISAIEVPMCAAVYL